MSDQKLTATGRKDEGKGASRRLRRAGRIPAIIYGGGTEPRSIQLEQEKTWVASQKEWFYSSIIELDVDGKVESVLLRDMQRHPYKQIIMHLDFQRVNKNEAIRMSVPLHFVNGDTSPAGKAGDVVIMHELTEVAIACLPGDLPLNIEVDLSNLALGDTVHLSNLVLPKGVEIPQLKLGSDHDVAVVVARHGRVEAEETAEGDEAEVPKAAEGKGASEGEEK
jgi:large subunit ribosomal protein L25